MSIAAVGGLLLITGCGIGTVLPLTTVSVQNAVLPWQLGTVTGLVNFIGALASALMVALVRSYAERISASGARGSIWHPPQRLRCALSPYEEADLGE